MRKRLNIDTPILVASIFIVLILIVGNVYSLAVLGTATFISPEYLLIQLQGAAFLGVTAAGMMMVILLGHIDLSVPWTLAASAMLATDLAARIGGAGDGGIGFELVGLGVGLGVGVVVGLINGLGVAFLRVPSMIFTLGVNTVLLGLMVMLTGGFAPQTAATGIMTAIGAERTFGVIPNAIWVWIAVSVVIYFILSKTSMGRYMYAIGNRETATYLSGVNTRGVLVAAFVMCSTCASIAGLMIAGYSNRSYQAMGDEYLLPSIAAVVLGGTHILGGKGRYLGTVLGAVLIVLLQSVLSVMQMPEAGRQIIYGAVIVVMLVIYGRGEQHMRA